MKNDVATGKAAAKNTISKATLGGCLDGVGWAGKGCAMGASTSVPRVAGCIALAGFAVLAAAEAEATVRFVATTGFDTNACTQIAPCRTIQKAHDVAAAGDTIQILNTGDYLVNVFITKSITISGTGVSAAIEAISVDNVNANVVLRDLHLHGRGVGFAGLFLNEANVVHVIGCEIENYSGPYGILVDDVNYVWINDTVVRDNAGDGANLFPGGDATIDNSRFENNGGHGIRSSASLTLIRTVMSGNTQNGILASSDTRIFESVAAHNGANGFGGEGPTLVESSVALGNGLSGLTNGVEGTARVSNSIFTDNTTGITNGGVGFIYTRGNNTVRGNGTEVSGTLTALAGS